MFGLLLIILVAVFAVVALVVFLTVSFWRLSPKLGSASMVFTAMVGLYFRINGSAKFSKWLPGILVWVGALLAIRLITFKSHDNWRYLVVTVCVVGALVGTLAVGR
jgi:hypothetical protein